MQDRHRCGPGGARDLRFSHGARGASSCYRCTSGDHQHGCKPENRRQLLLIEPDLLSVSVAEPPEMRAFWDGWLAWSRERGIDYHIGRTLAPRLAPRCLTNISGTAETAVYNGNSLWANYWIETITELRDDLITSGKLDEALIDKFLVHCADSTWWTQTIGFTAVHGRTSRG